MTTTNAVQNRGFTLRYERVSRQFSDKHACVAAVRTLIDNVRAHDNNALRARLIVGAVIEQVAGQLPQVPGIERWREANNFIDLIPGVDPRTLRTWRTVALAYANADGELDWDKVQACPFVKWPAGATPVLEHLTFTQLKKAIEMKAKAGVRARAAASNKSLVEVDEPYCTPVDDVDHGDGGPGEEEDQYDEDEQDDWEDEDDVDDETPSVAAAVMVDMEAAAERRGTGVVAIRPNVPAALSVAAAQAAGTLANPSERIDQARQMSLAKVYLARSAVRELDRIIDEAEPDLDERGDRAAAEVLTDAGTRLRASLKRTS